MVQKNRKFALHTHLLHHHHSLFRAEFQFRTHPPPPTHVAVGRGGAQLNALQVLQRLRFQRYVNFCLLGFSFSTENAMSIKAAGKEYKVLFSPHRPLCPPPRSFAPQAFIDLLSTQLSSDVARLIKELKTQAEEAIREAEKFDKIRSDFAGTVQKIEVVFPLQFPLAICCFCFVVHSRRCADHDGESSG